MNIEAMKQELRAEKKRIDAILSILEGSESMVSTPTHIAAPAAMAEVSRQRKGMSSETRQKISTSMKANWNRVRKGRKVSPEVRAKISAAQKQRWAIQKAASVSAAPLSKAA